MLPAPGTVAGSDPHGQIVSIASRPGVAKCSPRLSPDRVTITPMESLIHSFDILTNRLLVGRIGGPGEAFNHKGALRVSETGTQITAIAATRNLDSTGRTTIVPIRSSSGQASPPGPPLSARRASGPLRAGPHVTRQPHDPRQNVQIGLVREKLTSPADEDQRLERRRRLIVRSA